MRLRIVKRPSPNPTPTAKQHRYRASYEGKRVSGMLLDEVLNELTAPDMFSAVDAMFTIAQRLDPQAPTITLTIETEPE